MNPLQAGKVKKMDRTTIRHIREILEDNLPSLMEENNLKFNLGNATYDDDSVKFQFRISLSHALPPEEKALKQQLNFRKTYDHAVTLDDSIIAEDKGRKFKLVGFKPRASKKPFIIEDVTNGQRYICSESMAERMFKEVK